jgi:fucose permease
LRKPEAAADDLTSPQPKSEEPLDMPGFLTTTDMSELPQNLTRPQPTQTQNLQQTRRNKSPTLWNFVNMNRQKSMVEMTNKESIFPVTMVTVLFFLWGVAYGFLDTLNSEFQMVAQMSLGQSIGIHSAYYAGYFFAPMTFGRIIFKKWGFKACFIVGLCIYGCGTLVFWPSAVLASFPAFLISNFIVGLGLSTLEVACNPFSALCGPPQYAEVRLNISQGVQAIGSVLSPLLAAKVLFPSSSAQPLVDAQWTYFGIALFVILLAVVYYYVPFPEATDQVLEEASERADMANLAEIKGIRIIWITLGLGAFSQFCYVGAQESISTSFNSLFQKSSSPTISTIDELAIAHTTFAVARFIGAFLALFIKPRFLLLVFYVGAIILSALAMTYKGNSLFAIVMLLYFCEGPIFSLIYAMSLRGLGKHTKDGSALLTASIAGGAIMPPIMNAAAHGQAKRTAYSYSVVTATFAFGALLPVYVNLWPAARKQVDPIKRDQPLPNNVERSSLGDSHSRASNVYANTIKKKNRWTKIFDGAG